ncbi:MAG: pantetheine-phosphate adenylyltransferase [Armatimonadetes bacterium]|nr:pantetheine-phosphate adenylyltransferase [Armatimonadota bacterium]
MRIAIYPGSFDPLTRGHLDVIERAARQYDKVIIGVGINGSKKPFMPAEFRLRAIVASTVHIANVETESFEGLLIHFARDKGAKVIVRGLRATSDFDYEFQIAMANRRLSPDLETIFLMTKWEHSFLSSSVVREVALLGGDFSSFVPEATHSIISEFLSLPRIN